MTATSTVAAHNEDWRLPVPAGHHIVADAGTRRTLMVVMLGCPAEKVDRLGEQFAQAQIMVGTFRPFFVTDTTRPSGLQRHGYLVQHVMSRSRHAASVGPGGYDNYLQGRLSRIASIYRPDGVLNLAECWDIDWRGILSMDGDVPRTLVDEATIVDASTTKAELERRVLRLETKIEADKAVKSQYKKESARLTREVAKLTEQLSQTENRLRNETQVRISLQHDLEKMAGQVLASEPIAAVRALIEKHVPVGEILLVASKGDPRLLDLPSHEGWHFLQGWQGAYAGHHPRDSSEAIGHLEALRARGASYLVLPVTAFWWREHYRAFFEHLDEHYTLVAYEHMEGMIYRLYGDPVRA